MTRLRAGDRCPDFNLPADDGTSVSRESLMGIRYVLYFYPRDESPGCTRQACDLRDEFFALRDLSVRTYGVSPDSIESHRAFRARHGLPFPLLSDEGHSVAESFGVWVERTNTTVPSMTTERSTFVIGPHGRIETVLANSSPERHAEQLLSALRGAVSPTR